MTSADIFPPTDFYTQKDGVKEKPLSAFKISPTLKEGDGEVIIIYKRRTGGWLVEREFVRKLTARKLSTACTKMKKQVMKTVNEGG